MQSQEKNCRSCQRKRLENPIKSLRSRSCCRESRVPWGLACGLLSFGNIGIITAMGKRALTYIAVFFFSVSWLMFACPDVYIFSTVSHHSSRAGKMPDRDPCGNADNKASPSPCYQGLHDRFFPPATISGPLGGQGATLGASDNSLPGVPIFFAQPPAWRSKSPPKLALTVLFPVLRI